MIAPHSGPIQRGRDLKLACTASGKPAPNIAWTFNETTNLNELSRISNSRYLTGGQNLTVNTTTYRDAGTYTCTATNKAGTDSTSVNIEIQGKMVP